MKKKIGMVIAVEFEPFKDGFGEPNKLIRDKGFETVVYEKENYILYVTKSGVGETFGAITTQYLIDVFEVEMILNYGVVGALSGKLSHSLICLIKEVVDYRFDVSEIDNCPIGVHEEYKVRNIETNKILREKALETEPSLLEVRCASGDKFVGSSMEKEKIAEEFGADICEMEAAGILLTANRSGVPSLFIKVIADTLFGGAGEYSEKSKTAARECTKILDHIMSKI